MTRLFHDNLLSDQIHQKWIYSIKTWHTSKRPLNFTGPSRRAARTSSANPGVCIQAIKTPSDASVAARIGRVLRRDTAEAVHDSVALHNFRPMSRTSPCCGQVARSGSRLQDVGLRRGRRSRFLGKCQRVARAIRLARGSGRPFTPSTPSPPTPPSRSQVHTPPTPLGAAWLLHARARRVKQFGVIVSGLWTRKCC